MVHRTVVTLLLVLSAVLLAGVGALIMAEPHHASQTKVTHTAPRPGALPTTQPKAEVTIAAGGHPIRIPESFLGLSTEYWATPAWDREGAVLDRVLSFLHVPGDGPLVLRIGGDSANEALWESEVGEFPEWIVELTPSWLAQTSALARQAGVRLILDLNVITASPEISAQWAGAAEAALPRGSIAGFEIGNEPDLYSRSYWIKVVAQTIAASQPLPDSLSPAAYAADFGQYAGAVAAVAAGVPLLGPAVASPVRGPHWISALLASQHPGLRAVTAHQYPYSACARPGSPRFPTIARLLGEPATVGMAKALEPGIRLAAHAGLPFRLTELNSVTCGGRPGVSNTFATALWAPDALFELLRAGVNAVNIHVRPGTSNAAFWLSSHGLSANPLLYGLVLFARAVGHGSELVPLHVAAHGLALKVWAVRLRSGALHVLLINKGSRTATVVLRFLGFGPGSVCRMLAPSVSSRRGVTLGGRHLSVSGRWLGTRASEVVLASAAGYMVTVPRFSAALFESHRTS